MCSKNWRHSEIVRDIYNDCVKRVHSKFSCGVVRRRCFLIELDIRKQLYVIIKCWELSCTPVNDFQLSDNWWRGSVDLRLMSLNMLTQMTTVTYQKTW